MLTVISLNLLQLWSSSLLKVLGYMVCITEKVKLHFNITKVLETYFPFCQVHMCWIMVEPKHYQMQNCIWIVPLIILLDQTDWTGSLLTRTGGILVPPWLPEGRVGVSLQGRWALETELQTSERCLG